jgi:hypothetical protein
MGSRTPADNIGPANNIVNIGPIMGIKANIVFHLLCHLLFLTANYLTTVYIFNMFGLFLIFFRWNFFSGGKLEEQGLIWSINFLQKPGPTVPAEKVAAADSRIKCN